jgi:hypothetical protein
MNTHETLRDNPDRYVTQLQDHKQGSDFEDMIYFFVSYAMTLNI